MEYFWSHTEGNSITLRDMRECTKKFFLDSFKFQLLTKQRPKGRERCLI